MDYVYLTDFLVNYSLPMIIIASVVSLFYFIVKKFFSEKLPSSLINYLPFILAICLYFAYDMIFISKMVIFKRDSFYAGILSGSLSAIINGIALRISKGKPISVSQTVLLIESILSGYVKENNLSSTASAIEQTIFNEKTNTCPEKLANLIKSNSDMRLNEADYLNIAKLIIVAVTENVNNKKA